MFSKGLNIQVSWDMT